GATAQIKQNPSRSGTKAIDWALYEERNLVERFFNQIKRFRRIALRCEKTVASFKGFVSLACAMAWLHQMKTPPGPAGPGKAKASARPGGSEAPAGGGAGAGRGLWPPAGPDPGAVPWQGRWPLPLKR
ncbi:MAG: transposase, partial [Rhodobacter sp.]|nr:transposase [Rhodobacter sp.]